MHNFSYWELKTWFRNVDYAVIGSGIVGLNAALHLRKLHPKSKIIVLERGLLPNGASTKNAGFACFGSLSELISDLKTHTEEEVFRLVEKRFDGIALLRETLGDETIGYKNHGGYEYFLNKHEEVFSSCNDDFSKINGLLHPIFKSDAFVKVPNKFQFKKILNEGFLNPFESQINTGKMMQALLKKAISEDILILNNISVATLEDFSKYVEIKTEQDIDLRAKQVLVATNGFAAQLLKLEVKPARAQVLVTEPIDSLHIKGTFHLDHGFYYFRNIGNRILFGGGRNLDFSTEETHAFGLTALVQNQLVELLETVILPNKKFKVDQRWSGIMGVGAQKWPIVKQVSNRVFCAVRMGGMGVALGSEVGRELAEFTK
jgi:glycine/D-amino acid oxidase-like deaminating enzyme